MKLYTANMIRVRQGQRLFGKLPGEPNDQAGAGDREDDAGDPAVSDSDQVSQESADDAADDAQERVPQESFGLAVHDFGCDGSA